MNRRHTEPVYCLHCGKEIGTGWQFKNRKYCDNVCNAQHLKAKPSREWQDKALVEGCTWREMRGRWKSLRGRLVAEIGKCEICGQPPTWNGQPLSLELDHIDGDLDHNTRDNLRVVCPHCHTQTAHYGSKNKGRGRPAKEKQAELV